MHFVRVWLVFQCVLLGLHAITLQIQLSNHGLWMVSLPALVHRENSVFSFVGLWIVNGGDKIYPCSNNELHPKLNDITFWPEC